jgi:hypothetical protein
MKGPLRALALLAGLEVEEKKNFGNYAQASFLELDRSFSPESYILITGS